MTARRPRGVPELPVVGEQRQVEESLGVEETRALNASLDRMLDRLAV